MRKGTREEIGGSYRGIYIRNIADILELYAIHKECEQR
jgi:hypothetical protein